MGAEAHARSLKLPVPASAMGHKWRGVGAANATFPAQNSSTFGHARLTVNIIRTMLFDTVNE
jgi:hypothetical protein